MGLTQQELADAAGVSRQSISNIESGATVPQNKSLTRILDVLGVSSSDSEYSDETQLWLGILAGMLEALPVERRAVAGQAAVTAVTTELVSSSHLHAASNVVVGGFGQDGESDEDELEIPENVEEEWGLAAHPKTELPQDHTP